MAKSTKLKARLVLFNGTKTLLLKQTKRNGGNYSLVGGNIDAEEFARTTLVRESMEEAGIILHEPDLQLIHVLHKRTKNGHRIILYFRTDYWQGSPESREPKKFKSVEWCSLYALPENLTSTVRHVLGQIKRGNKFSEFLKE